MKKYHSFTVQEVEALLPFERDLFMDMIKSDIQKQIQEAEKRQGVSYAFG